ncbi:MAG: 1-phosphofructokinase family hexose kinase [Oscillospiraceae bacterium]
MITTVTLNPCIDYTAVVNRLEQGALNLMTGSRMDASGKGVNVALVLDALGVDCFATGISFENNHNMLAGRLDSEGIPHDFVLAPGNIRTNIKLYDESAGNMTEINSTGEPVEPSTLEALADKLDSLAARSEVVAFSGRIANGAASDIYRRLMERLSTYPVKLAVDADGEPLAEALKAKPWLIKPNDYELGKLVGRKLETDREIVAACRELIAGGVEIVCVSLGADGALIADKREAWRAKGLSIPVRGLQGAGDSMVAGICKAAVEGQPLRELLRSGMAASAGSVIREGTLLSTKEDYLGFLSQVQIEAII